MIIPVMTQDFAGTGLDLNDFESDLPKPPVGAVADADGAAKPDLIDGVTATPLVGNADVRGSLFELLTTRDGPIEPIVHVYQVFAAPGSIRAWVYHRHQYDRLAFIMGRFEIALYDVRPGSRTANRLNVFTLGAQQPCLLRIPPFVIHGVRNAGAEGAYFINLPTNVYDRSAPDKARLPYDDPRIPYVFDAR
jgi:dTDP-4-dehydrorhamnose 3,5-epimerase